MQWVQDHSQSNVDNLNNVRFEASRHFKNEKNIWMLNLRNFKITVR